MKKSIPCFLFSLLALAAVANTSWYRRVDMYNSNSNYLKDLSYWGVDSATGPAGSGAPTANDDLYLVGNVDGRRRLRTGGNINFAGNSFTIGDSANSNEIVHDNSRFITFANAGLNLVNGNWWFNWGSTITNPGGIAGNINVLSPAANPFLFHVGQDQYSNNVIEISAPFHGEAGTGVRFGYMKSRAAAPRTIYSLSGGIDDYAGEISISIDPKFTMTVDDYLSRVDLKSSTTSSAKINLEYGATLSEVGNEGSRIQLGEINFSGNPCRLELKCMRKKMTHFVASGAVNFAAGAKVYVSLTSSLPTIYAGERLPVLTAPASATFTAGDFELMFNELNQSEYLSLEVAATENERTLYVVSSEPEPTASWYLKTSLNDRAYRPFENMKYWQDVNGAAGEDAAFVDAFHYVIGSNYRVRLSGATVFSGLSLTLGDDAGYGEIIHDNGIVTLQNDGAILSRGNWWFNEDINFEVQGKMTVRSPREAPFAFLYGQEWFSNCTAVVSGPIEGSAETALMFGKSLWQKYAYAPRQTIELGDIDNYAGSMVVAENVCNVNPNHHNTGDDFGTCLRLPVNRAASAAQVTVQAGGSVAPAGSGVARVNSITFEKDSQLQVWGSAGGALGCLESAGLIAIAADARPLSVHWHTFVREGFGVCRDAILRAPADASDFTTEDFVFVAGRNFSNGGVRLVVEVDEVANTRTLYLETCGVVYHNQTYSDEHVRDDNHSSSMTNSAFWSDNLLPHAQSRYISTKNLRTEHLEDKPYTFPGESLCIKDSGLFAVASAFIVPELVLEGTSRLKVCQKASYGTHFIATNIIVSGTMELRSHSGHLLALDGPVSGRGEFICGCSSGTGAPMSIYEFNGDNSGYLGRIQVTMHEYRDEYVSLESNHSTLRVNRPESLGGRLTEFDHAALKLTHLSALAVTNAARAMVLSGDLNRGLYAFEKAQFDIVQNAVLDLAWPLTVRGQLWKRGPGTVILRAATKHLTADNGELTDVPTAGSNILHVAAGTLRIAHPDALAGLKVDVAGASTLEVAYAQDGDFAARGIDLTKLDGVIELAPALGGRLAWAIDADGAETPVTSTEMALATVRAADAPAYRAMLGPAKRRTWPEISQRLIEKSGDGTVTFAVKFARRGLMLSFR